MNNIPLLQGKTVLVVGGAGRIGQGIVGAVLSAGGRVHALDTDAAGLQALTDAHGTEALHCATLDIADRASIEEAMADAHERLGRVDGAVNTAYPRNARYGRHFFDVEYADFCENTGLHMGGYFLFMQACARYAVERGTPFSLVNLSSVYGSMAPRFDVYVGTSMTMPIEYAATKAGLENITRYVNAYMKGRSASFRANCVSPGGIKDSQDELFQVNYRAHCISKGMLESADVVGTVLFLLSDQSRHVAGQTHIIDDGFSL